MAQIEALDQFYQDQVSKSWAKLGSVQKIDLKVRHHPKNRFFFKNFSEFSQNHWLWSIEVTFHLFT